MKAALLKVVFYLGTGVLIRLFWLFESTLDIRASGMENLRLLKRQGERPLVVIWHGKGFVPIAYLHEERLCLYASHGRDPNYGGFRKSFRTFTLRMIERMGYTVLDATRFASEARGVLHFVQALRGGQGGTIAADGPGGPSYEAKPGACFLAKKCNVTLLPVGAAIASGMRLDQWDQFEIPRLFSRATLVIEEPIRVPDEASDEELETITHDLENALNRATRRAEEKLDAEKRIAVANSSSEGEYSESGPSGQAAGGEAELRPRTILRSILEFFFGAVIEDLEERAGWRHWESVSMILIVLVILGIMLLIKNLSMG